MGYCSWKALLFFECFRKLDDGDVVFYVDADCKPIGDLTPIFDIAARDGACFFASAASRSASFAVFAVFVMKTTIRTI